MKILYINENADSAVHNDLCNGLQRLGIEVTSILINRQNVEVKWESDAEYDLRIIKPSFEPVRYRLDFRYKIKEKLKLILSKVNIENFDFIYASTLFSDGAVALRIKHIYNIPFIALIRSTDVDFYAKKMVHLWPIGRKIIREASWLIGISPLSCPILQKTIAFKNLDIEDKFSWIPNAVDSFWINNINKDHEKKRNAKHFLCISTFIKRKNLPATIKAFQRVRAQNPEITLTLVGGNGEETSKIMKLIGSDPSITYLGRIKNKKDLIKVYRDNDAFILPSWQETFGLVYIEALSQNLPIIYSHNTGVDGYFDNVGEQVNPHKLDQIETAIRKMAIDITKYDNIFDKIQNFQKDSIASRHQEILHQLQITSLATNLPKHK